MKKIAIIGAGNMGGAIARGILCSDLSQEYSVTVSNRTIEKLNTLKNEFPVVNVTMSNVDAATGADVIILAVKPWLIGMVAKEICSAVRLKDVVVASLAAGVSIGDLSDAFVDASRGRSICRVMPNTAVSVGKSMTFISGDYAAGEKIAELDRIFSVLGKTAIIPERLIPAAMSLCSCGIAYALRYIRAATEGAVELGIYPDDAVKYVSQTLRGAVALLEASGAHPEAEIDRVTTPGGVTIKGLNSMEKYGFTNAVIEGLKASAK